MDIGKYYRLRDEEAALSEEEAKKKRFEEMGITRAVVSQGKHMKKKLASVKKEMETDGRLVRCMDCIDRKKCPIVRVNKYISKPCKKFVVNLKKQSNVLRKKN